MSTGGMKQKFSFFILAFLFDNHSFSILLFLIALRNNIHGDTQHLISGFIREFIKKYLD
jgi:hypothetical protein